jgi:CBS domain-containing protein
MIHTTLGRLLEGKGSQVITGAPNDSIYDCVMKMTGARIGGLLIMEDGQIVGIFTERDLLNKVVPNNINVQATPVSDVMNHDVLCVDPDLTLEEAMSIFTEKRIRHLPVLEGSKLIGLISIGDVTKWLSDSHRQQVQEIDDLVKYINGGYSV